MFSIHEYRNNEAKEVIRDLHSPLTGFSSSEERMESSRSVTKNICAGVLIQGPLGINGQRQIVTLLQ